MLKPGDGVAGMSLQPVQRMHLSFGHSAPQLNMLGISKLLIANFPIPKLAIDPSGHTDLDGSGPVPDKSQCDDVTNQIKTLEQLLNSDIEIGDPLMTAPTLVFEEVPILRF